MAGVQIYPYHFTSEVELETAFNAHKLGSSDGNYKNWFAVITDNLTPKSVQVTSSISLNVWSGALDSYDKVVESRIIWGNAYSPSVGNIRLEDNGDLLLEDGETIILEDVIAGGGTATGANYVNDPEDADENTSTSSSGSDIQV